MRKSIISCLLLGGGILVTSLTVSLVIEHFFDISTESTFSGITTLLAIVVTFYTYSDQKKSLKDKEHKEKLEQVIIQQREAAKLVVMQIDHADSVIKIARKNKKISAVLPKFIGESEWDKNKHVLVERLKSTDLDFINSYFIACEQLEETRKIIVNLQAEQLNEKARCIQQELAREIVKIQEHCDEYTLPADVEDLQKTKVLPFFNRFNYMYISPALGEYEPQYSQNLLTQVLFESNLEIKTTMAYRTLREIAAMD
ncbi:hypothetical protein [Photobacterium leiognathi]|uniref:hypothetical protein n=1 Tax=Photobacterium leiognathi TaxID=553611 RepID=UPI002739ABA5|nr:hypothetical protein [Photobacterium leiognathi]